MRKLFSFLFIILSPFVSAEFTKVLEHDEGDVFANPDKSIRITVRKHTADLPTPISEKNLKGIAETRFYVLKKLEIGFKDFKIDQVYKTAVSLKDSKSYVWRGSYKDKKGKARFVVEFITSKHTYNVFTDKEYDLEKASKVLKEVI
ncbi:MAG: hypothetical protein OXC37_04490 [Bdellovibrionaceae bacterium]|nr:hypothetical protein [Pseudobdellovibrionaceae bacterium]